jgi:hypothetical protein
MKTATLRQSEAALRRLALAYPEATEDFPWGHRAIKVKGKAFVFMSLEKDCFSLSAKLPDSASEALVFPVRRADPLRPRQGGLGHGELQGRRSGAGGAARQLDRRELPRDRAEEAERAAAGAHERSPEGPVDQAVPERGEEGRAQKPPQARARRKS